MSTFLSAPVMFISAQMSLLNYNTQTAINFEKILKNAMVDISGTSLPFGVSTLYMYVLLEFYYGCLSHPICIVII